MPSRFTPQSEGSDSSSSFSAPIRFYPNYGHRWRTVLAGYPEQAQSETIPPSSVDTIQRRNFGRDWEFTDLDEEDYPSSMDNAVMYFDDDDDEGSLKKIIITACRPRYISRHVTHSKI